MTAYTATSEKITITVHPIYLDGQSDFIAKKFVFAYYVRIKNNRSEPVQLLRQHWYIYDADGKSKEIKSEGVAGKQPVISPGGVYEYTSFCVLGTFEGYVEGTYIIRRSNGEEFEVIIPRFSLRAAVN